VRGNRFVDNGFNGFDANGSSTRDREDDLLVEGNVFEGNNSEVFGEDCKRSCSAAAVKLAHMDGLVVRDNVFAGTREGHGLWCDLDCSGAVITSNVFRDNEGAGLYYEVSSDGVIADNLMVGNRDYGLKSGSAHMLVFHNTMVDNGTSALLYDDDRSPGVDGWDDVGPDTVDNHFVANVLSGGAPAVSAWRTSTKGDNTGPGTFMVTFDANTYHRSSEDDTLVDWRTANGTTRYESVEELNEARGHEDEGQDLVGDDALFVDADRGDYRISPESAAADSGVPLPEEVAEALDVEAGSVLDRGALTVLRSPA
jgi:parallel beta-helix repeat protein